MEVKTYPMREVAFESTQKHKCAKCGQYHADSEPHSAPVVHKVTIDDHIDIAKDGAA